MKRFTAALTVLSVVALLPGAGFAQTSTTERAKRDRPTWSNTQGLHETSDIIGAKVEGPDGKDLGKVEALLIDPKEGKVSHAVVEVGGVLGMGGEKVVVPYTALKMTGQSGRRAKITVDQTALDQAPKYVKASDRQPAASPATTPRSDTERPAPQK